MAHPVATYPTPGIRQFLDLGSGIPTEGNVHEVAQAIAPDARVAYVDIDPVAVAEGLELLEGNDTAIAMRADLRSPATVLHHPAIGRLLDFDRPIAVLLCAVLHFVPDDDEAYKVVGQLIDALAPGSYLVISAPRPKASPRPARPPRPSSTSTSSAP